MNESGPEGSPLSPFPALPKSHPHPFPTLQGNNNYGAHFIDGRTRVPSLFTQSVDYSPFAMRKTAWVSVGRIDETSSDQGECGIWSDWELCTRLWAAGWQVMAMPDQAIRKPDDSGHHSGTHRVETGDRCWGRQAGTFILTNQTLGG